MHIKNDGTISTSVQKMPRQQLVFDAIQKAQVDGILGKREKGR